MLNKTLIDHLQPIQKWGATGSGIGVSSSVATARASNNILGSLGNRHTLSVAGEKHEIQHKIPSWITPVKSANVE
jgi:hypothetical protein